MRAGLGPSEGGEGGEGGVGAVRSVCRRVGGVRMVMAVGM